MFEGGGSDLRVATHSLRSPALNYQSLYESVHQLIILSVSQYNIHPYSLCPPIQWVSLCKHIHSSYMPFISSSINSPLTFQLLFHLLRECFSCRSCVLFWLVLFTTSSLPLSRGCFWKEFSSTFYSSRSSRPRSPAFGGITSADTVSVKEHPTFYSLLK